MRCQLYDSHQEGLLGASLLIMGLRFVQLLHVMVFLSLLLFTILVDLWCYSWCCKFLLSLSTPSLLLVKDLKQ